MTKVFGIGFQKTGTSSLGIALKYIGYRVQGSMSATSLEEAKRKANRKIKKFDGFQDMPWPLLYQWLDKKYPNGKFILTVRPEEEWIDSVCRHFGGRYMPTHEWIYGAGDPIGNEELYLSRYRRHNREVREYFDDRIGTDCLILNITDDEGWDKLCPFLGCSTPWISFPHRKLSEKKKREMDNIEILKHKSQYICQRFVIHYRQGRLLDKILPSSNIANIEH